MKKTLLTCLSALLCLTVSAQHTPKLKIKSSPRSESSSQLKVKQKTPSVMQLLGGITCNTSYIAGTTMNLNFNLLLSNTDAEYGDSLAITFPPGMTPVFSPTDPLGPDDGQAGSDGPEALNGISQKTISWGNNDNSYGGIVPGVNYPFVINVTIAAGVTGPKTVIFFISGDGFGGNGQDLAGSFTITDAPQPAAPINDSICGAIALTLGTTYTGNNTTAALTDPRDAAASAAGFACSTPNNTLWYSYTAAATDTFFITMNSPAIGGLDSWVGVFEGSACNAAFTTGACMFGPTPGTFYIDTVYFTAGSTYYIMIDGYAGAVGAFDIQLTQQTSGGSNFTGCLPTNTYAGSAWQEATAIGTPYSGYVCNGHDSLQTRTAWQFYDGDGYFVYFVAGGQYRIALDSCASPIALTVSDSNGVAGTIIPTAFANAACPNQLTFIAPYTGKYYINTSLNGICGNSGASAVASGSIKLLNSVTCPALPAAPINDTICGAIAMTLGTTYTGNNTAAALTDPRDADASAAGFACSTPNNTLWYSYTAAATDTFFITMNSPAIGGLDSWVGVFEGSACNAAFTTGACMFGPTPGTFYIDTVYFTAGSTYYIMIDGYAGAVGAFDIQLTQQTGGGNTFNGCLPTNTYTSSAWQEPSAVGTIYNGYVCNGHDSLQTRSGWQFYDGDGYYAYLVAGGQYRIALDSCTAPIALTVSDSNGVAGTIIPAAFANAACPNQLTFIAPYTGKYYINTSLNGICGNSGTAAVASGSIKLLNSVICPTLPTAPSNDTICGAIAMTLGTIYTGNNTAAALTDPRDADASAAGFACSTPNNTLWYSYTAAATDTFFITMNSPAIGGLDSWVGVFEGSTCNAAFTTGACMFGPTPGTYYIDTVYFTAGTTYYIMIDGYAGAVGAFDIQLTQQTGGGSNFTGCLPTNTYSSSAWQEATAIGTPYSGYVCNGHDSLQTRTAWQFYDGDGYFVYFVAGGQYRIALDSCASPIALTVSDSNGVAGTIIPTAFANAACPNQLTFIAPYTGKYYINTSLNGICGNSGTAAVASGSIKLLNSVICPTLPTAPINDTICGAIAMTLGTTYNGNSSTASATDPRDADVITAGFGCSTPNNTLWYSYTAAATDTFFITMNSPAVGGLDAWIGVFEANTCNSTFLSGACMLGPLPGNSYTDTVVFTAGSTYFIMTDGYAGAVGSFSLVLTQNNSTTTNYPYNDTICGAINMTLGTTYADDNSTASLTDPSDANAISAGFNCDSPSNSLWYSYTPSVTDTFYMSSSSPALGGANLVVSAFEAATCSGTLTNGICYPAALSGGSVHVDTLYLTSGTTYYFMMDGEANSTGLFNITLTKANHGVGINEVSTSQLFTLYPNPTNGMINLSFQNTSTDFEIYNALGAKVFEQSKLNQGTHTFNLSALAKGIYSVKATSGNKMEIKTISIQH